MVANTLKSLKCSFVLFNKRGRLNSISLSFGFVHIFLFTIPYFSVSAGMPCLWDASGDGHGCPHNYAAWTVI